MKTILLLGVALASVSFAQTTGNIINPIPGEVIGGTYASQGTATSSGSTIPAFINTTATLSTSTNVVSVASAAGIVVGQLAVSANLTNGAAKVTGISGTNITLATIPATAGLSVPLQFESVYFNFDGIPGCATLCGFGLQGAPASSVSFDTVIGAGLGQWGPGAHTISLTVVDAAGNTSTTGNTSVIVSNSDSAGNCSNTLISGAIRCMGAATSGTTGPTTSVTLAGMFQAGDVLHASQFLNRPASPFTTSISGVLNATQTNVTITAPPIYTGTASTSGSSTTATLDATSYGQVCATQLGQVITGTGFPAGTAVIKCLVSNQVLLSQAANATSASVSIQHTFPTATGIATAAVAGGGSNFVLSDIVLVAGGTGGHLRVTSVGAGGAITGVVPIALTPAEFFTANGYSNGSGVSVSGGSGTGATVNITAGFLATITDLGIGPGYEQMGVTSKSAQYTCGLSQCIDWVVVRGSNGSQGIAHSGGHVGAFDPGPYPLLPSYISDNVGNTWTLITHAETGFSDDNTVDTGVYYTTLTSGTAAAASSMGETVTFTHPFAQLTFGIVSLNVKWYRGLGALGNFNNAQSTMGYAGPSGSAGPFNASMALNRVIPTAAGNAWPVSVNDLCIVTAAGSPFMVVNASPPGPTTNILSYPRGGSGSVSASMNTLTWLSGTPFNTAYSMGDLHSSAWQPGSFVVLGGSTTVHIAAVIDSTHITTIESLTTSASETYSVPDGGSAASPASGWVLRERDPSRMFDLDAIATSTSCNGGALVTNVDGMDTIGVAFHPAASSTAVFGQSAFLSSTNQLANTTVPAVNTSTGTAVVEFEIDNVNATGNDTFLTFNNLSTAFQITQLGGGSYALTQTVSPFSGWDGKGLTQSCGGNGFGATVSNVASVGGNKPVYVRYQIDYSQKMDWIEFWDGTGFRFYASYCGWTTANSTAAGVTLGGAMAGSDTLQVGFLWQHSGTVPMNSKMPTFAHTGSANCIYDWHFDTAAGNAADSCGGAGYALTATGTVSYPDTPSAVQSVVKANPTQIGAASTSVSGWVTMNSAAGTQQMDGLAQSFTQYNASDSLSFAWSQTQGPTVTFDNSVAARPTITGSCSGLICATNTSAGPDYILSVTASDTQSPPATATGSIEMGAAPLDVNGVVTNVTGKAGQFFGPLIGYGFNPWGEADTLQYQMIGLQTAYQSTASPIYRDWAIYPSAGGTISYPFTAKGQGYGIPGTAVCATPVAPTDAIITICDITKLSTFPTWIMVGTLGVNYELARVTGCVSTCPGSGQATLQVAYDGRGLSGNWSAQQYNGGTPAAAGSWSIGATVGELRVTGSGTHFHSDTTRPLAEYAVPGPVGCTASCGNSASPGTVVIPACVSACGATLVGSGTGWTSSVIGATIVVSGATHSSTSFNFWRQITGWTDATHVTLDHAFPNGMDAYSGAYQLVNFAGSSTGFFVDLEFPSPQDGHTVRTIYPMFGCESETACFGIAKTEVVAYDVPSAIMTGQKYSWQLGFGAAGIFNPNFYGFDIAARNFYLRSGYYPALLLANFVSEYWVRSPEVGDGFSGGFPFSVGGGVIGAMGDILTNPSTALIPGNLETFAFGGISDLLVPGTLLPQACNADDTRDTGIIQDFITQEANWDANTGAGNLNGSVGVNSTGGTVTGWTGSMQAPPFLALITLVGSDTQYEVIKVLTISGTTWTWSPGVYPFGSGAHSNGAQVLSGAAMYTFLLTKLDIRDQKCRRNVSDGYAGNEVNSWAHAFNFSESNGPLTLTHNSAAGTGTALPSTMCIGAESGTLTINAGSYTATLLGSSIVGGPPQPPGSPGMWQRISIWDGTTLNSFAYVASAYNTTLATVTLAGAWGGMNCTSGSPCTYMTENTGNFTAIWNSNTDSLADNEALKKSWACIWNSSASITLNRPWDGPTNSNYFAALPQPSAGFQQQPFMPGGYKSIGMRWAQYSSNPTVAADYTTMAQQAGTWARNYGWDFTNSRGIFYVSVFQTCNPPTLLYNPALTTNPFISTLHGGDGGNVQGCGAVGSNIANAVARSQNPEVGSAMGQYFNINPVANKATTDSFYGATMGVNQAYGSNAGCSTAVASTCDGLDALNCELTGMAGYKWPGFCFGVGGFFSTSYPAVRTLVAPPASAGPLRIFGPGMHGRGQFFIDPSLNAYRWRLQ